MTVPEGTHPSRAENDEARQILTMLLCYGPEILKLGLPRELHEGLEEMLTSTQAWARKWSSAR